MKLNRFPYFSKLHPDRSGFTLIEMALILVALGIFISISAIAMQSLVYSRKIEENKKILAEYDRSVKGFLTSNYRIICPDMNNDGEENHIKCSWGMDSCADYTGYLPYLSLGLPSEKDAWGNKVLYSICDPGDQGSTDTITLLCDFLDSQPNDQAAIDEIYFNNAEDISQYPAYIIVSGGPKDLDDQGGFFDGYNGASPDVRFESPDKIASSTYDDFVIAVSFDDLYDEICTSSGEVK